MVIIDHISQNQLLSFHFQLPIPPNSLFKESLENNKACSQSENSPIRKVTVESVFACSRLQPISFREARDILAETDKTVTSLPYESGLEILGPPNLLSASRTHYR